MSESRIIIAIDWILRCSSLLAIIISLYLLVDGQFLVYYFGYVSSVSFGSVGALFIISEYSFSFYDGMEKIDALVFGILFPAAFLFTYEIIYHFSFLPSPSESFLFQVGEGLRYLATEGVVILPLIFLRKKLIFRKISALLLVVFIATWIVWLLYGFPQYYTDAPIYGHPLLITKDYWYTSLYLNFGSKTALAVFFASILNISYQVETRNLLHRLRIIR